MKLLYIALFSLLITKGCAEEDESGWQAETTEESGYEAKDDKARKAIADWQDFLKEAHDDIYRSRVALSIASDNIDNPHIVRKTKLRNAIINAEGDLERLSDQLLKAEKLSKNDIPIDEVTIEKMELFKTDFKAKQIKLREKLAGLNNDTYK